MAFLGFNDLNYLGDGFTSPTSRILINTLLTL